MAPKDKVLSSHPSSRDSAHPDGEHTSASLKCSFDRMVQTGEEPCAHRWMKQAVPGGKVGRRMQENSFLEEGQDLAVHRGEPVF